MVSDVAHELRSPVTNLRCTLEAMQDGLTAMDRAGIDVLHEETLFLQRLINDLQDLALAEAGRLDLQSAPVDVGDALRRAAAALGSATGAPITLAIEPDVPTVGDAGRLEQVIRNLLSNARQHTPSSERIVASVGRGPGDAVRIDVADSGDGIDTAHLPFVFDRFYRADDSRSRATGGAGLGFAIVRQVVLAHGGRVTAESDGPRRAPASRSFFRPDAEPAPRSAPPVVDPWPASAACLAHVSSLAPSSQDFRWVCEDGSNRASSGSGLAQPFSGPSPVGLLQRRRDLIARC
jgi:two-component system, OmpR family, sensor histidine kinase BaeS